MKTWSEMIILAMQNLGGHAKYEDLYKEMLKLFSDKMNSVENFRNSVRGCIHRYSSDSKRFDGKNDIFYSVEGKGGGHWGLRNFEPTFDNVDLTSDIDGFIEGKRKLKIHICKERNPEVIKQAKDRYKTLYGKFKCQICNFDFEEVYGEIGKDFIEGHHIFPISDLEEETITNIDDIVLVCSNCHSMLHRKRPCLKIEDLKSLIKK